MHKLKSLTSFVTLIAVLFAPVSPAFALGEIEVAPPSPAPVVQIVTPPADRTAPAISGVANLSLSVAEGTIIWTTDELAVSHLEYGTTESYGTQATLDASVLLAHTAILTGLSANTTYYYCIHATDLAGNTANSCGHSFATAAHAVIADTTAPDVTLITEGSLTTTSATITFTTSEVGNARIEYGTTAGYGETTALDTNLALTHAVTISHLTPNTTYHYRIISSDEAGNETITPDETFMTQAVSPSPMSQVGSVGVSVETPADTTPPAVSGVGSLTLGVTDATLAWTTNELSVSTLEYGTSQSYGSHATLSLTAGLAHTATLTGLTAGTTYYYCIHATDLAHNTTNSCPHSFRTEPTGTVGEIITPQIPSTSSPSVVVISGIDIASVSTSTVTIAWDTDLPADAQVEYGDSDNLGLLTTLNTTLATSHAVTILGLTPNTNYIFRVKSKAVGAAVATVSDNDEFDTLNYSIPVVAGPNVLSVASSGITGVGATITWNTDKAATTQVQYGISSSYGVVSAENTTLATTHTVSLLDLEPSTTYHFRIRSTDEVSNSTFSEDYTFTTAGSSSNSGNSVSGASVPTVITTLALGGYDNASVELKWHVTTASTDIAEQYDVRYSTSPIDAANFAQATRAQLTLIYYGDISPVGTERAYIVAGLNAHTLYYFAIAARHENSTYSDLSNVVSATTTRGESINNESNPHHDSILEVSTSLGDTPVSSGYGGGGGSSEEGTSAGSFEPTLVKAKGADGQIVVEWDNPGEANFVRTVVVRKEGSYPTSPSDGQTLYEGRGDTYADTNLQNGKTYYYAVYSYNHSKTYSRGVNLSLAPNEGNKQIKFNESGTLSSSTPALHFVRTWQKGDKDIEIEHLQEILVADNDSYPEKYVTGYFGSLTKAALKRFQAKHGLSQTGIVDAVTQQELNTVSHLETKLNIPVDVVVFSTDLKRGDQGETVKDLQQYLIYEGSYLEAIISGYFGGYTYGAVKTFQTKYGIKPISGYVGYKTRHRMQQLVGL